jgi:hypothetical protein
MRDVITYTLTPQESFLAVFCLGFDAAGHINTKRGDYLSLAERISEVPANGNLTIDQHDQARMIAAVDTTVSLLPATPEAIKKGVIQLSTHLRTGADAHAAGGGLGLGAHETTGARSGP